MALSYNQYRADIRSQSSQSARRALVVHAQSGSICRPLFFYALFAASLAKSPSSLIASHNIRSTVFAPYFWDGAARSGVGSNRSDIVYQRLPWHSVEKTFRIKSFFSWSVDSPAPWLQCSTPEKSAPHGNSSKPNLLGCLNFRRMESARAYDDRILQNSS